VKQLSATILCRGALALLGAAVASGYGKSRLHSASTVGVRVADTSVARVVLLGTGTPIADPERSGPSLAIVLGGASYLVDAGPGVVRRATAAASRDSIPSLRVANLRYVFLTHLHSDHTLGLPDLMLTPAVMHRKGALTVYGPLGTRAMVAKLLEAYREDIILRIHGLERGDSNAYRVIVHEVTPGLVYRDSNVTVTAFRVPHGSWRDAFGYRFDTRGRSIVVSGDTAPTDAIVTACHGCDVLIHEVYSKKGFDRLDSASRRYHSTFHTSAIELGDLATRAQPKLLLLTHILFFGESGDEIVAEARSRFKGQVVLGADLGVY
jgi:ribonuclease Z